ncbi:HAD family hydrolase [Natrononativus amylolyticus]|uniref:HAD family hydrolase n=1 Tax=Natrononativus amylolyticus TaxID=2963434 RepID=UPI0020CBACA1|nr:HAD family hydrolase [Natrononativus amylolyticus]
MTEYDAVVYDLDGTLVDLDVDWTSVALDVLELYAGAGASPPSEDLWELLAASSENGLGPEVESAIAAHEREGARTSRRLAHADELRERPVPIGVCSLNCEDACRIALEKHGLLEAVDAIVGRDSVGTRKPDPEPLLATVRELSATPDRTLFIGDSARDERTAERAGTAFSYVGDGPSGY